MYSGCPECPIETAAIVDQQGPLLDRYTDRLNRAQSRAMTGLTVHRVAAFVTDTCPTGHYTVERVWDQQFAIELPETASPWDVFRLVESFSMGPLSAERHDGAVSVTDARWSSVGTEANLDPVTDGGTVRSPADDESSPAAAENLFAVTPDDELRMKRAKTGDTDVSLLQTGGIFEVHSASDSYCDVDVMAGECPCSDTTDRCKHLQRVDLEIKWTSLLV